MLTVEGDFTGETTASLRRCAEELLSRGGAQGADFVVDLDRAAFIDSEALEALLWLKSRCEDGAGRMKLAGPSEHARKVLEITRLDHRFETANDVAAALKTMR